MKNALLKSLLVTLVMFLILPLTGCDKKLGNTPNSGLFVIFNNEQKFYFKGADSYRPIHLFSDIIEIRNGDWPMGKISSKNINFIDWSDDKTIEKLETVFNIYIIRLTKDEKTASK